MNHLYAQDMLPAFTRDSLCTSQTLGSALTGGTRLLEKLCCITESYQQIREVNIRGLMLTILTP